MDILFTAFALLCLSACVLCVYACIKHAGDAYGCVEDLRGMRGRLIGAEGAEAALEAKLDKFQAKLKSLEGRFYAERHKREEREDSDDEPRLGYGDGNKDQQFLPLAAGTLLASAQCENWTQAQVDGPRSKAAECECAYCIGARAARRAQKAAILAERNRKVNGSE